MSEQFDIRSAVAEIALPEKTVYATLNLPLAREVVILEERLAAFPDDAPEADVEAVKSELDAKRAELRDDARTYKVLVRGIDNAEKIRIQKDAVGKFPPVRDMMGRDTNEKQSIDRNLWVRAETLAAYVVSLTDGAGRVQSPVGHEVMRYLMDKAPDSFLNVIDEAIEEVAAQTDDQRALHQSPDFS